MLDVRAMLGNKKGLQNTIKTWIGWCLEDLVNKEVYPLIEYVIHHDQVRAQLGMNQ